MIERYLKRFGIVLLYGPKWCGKTSAGARVAKSAVFLSEDNDYNLAQENVDWALRGEWPRLVDEWQRVPQVWDKARNIVDKTGDEGLFLFTGSHAPRKGETFHSGAGRVGRLLMGPLTLYESGESSGTASLQEIVSGTFDFAECAEKQIEEIAVAVIRGGLPRFVVKPTDVPIAAINYIDASIEAMFMADDLDRSKLRLFMHSLARNESQPASSKKIREDVYGKERDKRTDELAKATATKYMGLLERFYFIRPTRPLEFNLRASVQPLGRNKLRYFDTFLPCSLLGATHPAALLKDVQTFGLLFESLCIRDLEAYAQAFGAEIRYYRDANGDEIDAVVLNPDLSWAGFEIKLGGGSVDQAAAKLIKLRDRIDDERKKPKALGIIVPTGKAAYKRKDGVYVIPITSLRP